MEDLLLLAVGITIFLIPFLLKVLKKRGFYLKLIIIFLLPFILYGLLHLWISNLKDYPY